MALLHGATRLILTPRMIPQARLRYEELRHLPLALPLRPFDDLFQSELPSGYQPPLGFSQDLPFIVERTRWGNLPVSHRIVLKTQVRTRVKKVIGDIELFADEFEKVTGKVARRHIAHVEVPGDHRDRVLIWLWALGF
eukprot:EG_transcript_33367